MNKIRTLFLTVQPLVLTGLINFFASAPLILPDFDDYSKHDYLLKDKKYEAIVFDDGSLSTSEIDIMYNLISGSNTPGILFTGETDKKYLHYFIENDIQGIVSKKEVPDKLQEAVISISNGKKYYSENIINFLFTEEKTGIDNLNILTVREKEIFILIRNGMQNKDIANELFLSVKTIESHVENIKKKLGLRTTKELKYLSLEQFPYKFPYKK